MFSPDVILCGWLGSRHQLTNSLLEPWTNLLVCLTYSGRTDAVMDREHAGAHTSVRRKLRRERFRLLFGQLRKRTQNMYTHGPWLVEPYPRPESSLPLLKDARGSVTSSPYKALHHNVSELFFLLFFLLCCAALSCILYCTESRLAHAVEQIRPASGVLALHRKSLPTVCELIQLPNFVITSQFCLKVFCCCCCFWLFLLPVNLSSCQTS